ncbi:hypothetical protein D3C78_1680030 [compost metagenome]
MAYQSNVDRPRLISQCKEHIQLLDLIEQGRREEAAAFLRQHLDVVSRLKAAREAQEARDLKQALAVADLG